MTNNNYSFIDRGLLWDFDEVNQVHPFTEGSSHLGRKKDMNFSGTHGTYCGKRLSGNHLMVYLALSAIQSNFRSPLHDDAVIRVHMRQLVAEIGWNGGFTKNSNKARPLLHDLFNIQYFKNLDGITSHGSDRLLPILDISDDILTFRLGAFAQRIDMRECNDGEYTRHNRVQARLFSGRPAALILHTQLSARVIPGDDQSEFKLETLIGYCFGSDFDKKSYHFKNHGDSVERYLQEFNCQIDDDNHQDWHIRLLRTNKLGQKIYGVHRTAYSQKTTFNQMVNLGVMMRSSHPKNQPNNGAYL
ncbi:hypothetical protein G6692_03700 [Polynucleobacter paneuropaeus]|uniref:Uncharacterized protein n=1 Tax=Polynucleobacter paneuropaeus TaxID=2527775 RepID=A0AAE3CHG3_9BURK|nr:hypothetical protein [Polynucleobacter paneuropaeus]MBT8591013.1 hypothetical protein [Polynucleobacter paneuropaeus]MBT8596404.1 hypothetical protein [Polynucleobacter paneuropaeus]